MASSAVCTTTSAVAHPPVGDTGVRTVTDEPDTERTVPGLPAPKSTATTASRWAPVMVTTVPPPAGPERTFIPVTTGQASTGVTRSGTSAEVTGEPNPLARS